jgi:hypothetical protein
LPLPPPAIDWYVQAATPAALAALASAPSSQSAAAFPRVRPSAAHSRTHLSLECKPLHGNMELIPRRVTVPTDRRQPKRVGHSTDCSRNTTRTTRKDTPSQGVPGRSQRARSSQRAPARETLRAKSPADIAGGRMLLRGPNLRTGGRAGAARGPGPRAVCHKKTVNAGSMDKLEARRPR